MFIFNFNVKWSDTRWARQWNFIFIFKIFFASSIPECLLRSSDNNCSRYTTIPDQTQFYRHKLCLSFSFFSQHTYDVSPGCFWLLWYDFCCWPHHIAEIRKQRKCITPREEVIWSWVLPSWENISSNQKISCGEKGGWYFSNGSNCSRMADNNILDTCVDELAKSLLKEGLMSFLDHILWL